MKIFKLFLFGIIFFSLLIPNIFVKAQSGSPEIPVYIVQPGDTINSIAIKFGVSAEDIIAVNNISDANFLQVNMQLRLPGIEGVNGVLTYKSVNTGETPINIARKQQIDLSTLFRLNRTTSPSEFFIGANVIFVENEIDQANAQYSFSLGSSILENSVIANQHTWEITRKNQVKYPWQILPQEFFYNETTLGEINDIKELDIHGLPFTQGKTASIVIQTSQPVINASIAGKSLQFSPYMEQQVALFGIHALLDPGLYPLHIEYQNKKDEVIVIDQFVLIQNGFFPEDPPLQVDPTTLDKSITQPEEDLFFSIVTPITPEKYWDDIFRIPVDEPSCIKSWFGNRRSYNGEPYNHFHTGVDYGVCANLNVYAPAPGKVVFSGPLAIRGNATIIDHGFGVYSGFWHQNKIFVELGQWVESGELIGEIGTTGRSTGPHLHWEVVVNGIQVEPLDWLEEAYP